MERTSSDEIFLAVVLANRWMERPLGTPWSFIKNFALHHKHVLPLFPIASIINPEVARSGLFFDANSWRNQVFNWFLMYLQVAIKFRTVPTPANPPIFRKVPTGSMDKAKESLIDRLGSEYQGRKHYLHLFWRGGLGHQRLFVLARRKWIDLEFSWDIPHMNSEMDRPSFHHNNS